MESSVDWSHCEMHLWVRHRVLVEWAKEAVADTAALVVDPDPASRSGRGMRIIGYSPKAGAILVVIVVRTTDALIAVTAWKANSTFVRRYREGKR